MAFKMNGKTYPSMLAIAKDLGKNRVYRKDFEKFGITEVDDTEVQEEVVTQKVETAAKVTEEVKAPKTEANEAKVAEEEPTVEAGLDKDDMLNRKYPGVSQENDQNENKEADTKKASETRQKLTDEEKKARRAQRRAERREKKRLEREEASKPTPEMLSKAEALRKKAGYTKIWDWAVDMKKKSAEEVFKIAEELGLTWERHDVERIDRMRAVMVLRQNLFPGEKRPKVRRSAWKGVTNDKLKELADENGVAYTETSDEKITRMHLIKALKDAGIESPKGN